jgi:hypothetical protein
MAVRWCRRRDRAEILRAWDTIAELTAARRATHAISPTLVVGPSADCPRDGLVTLLFYTAGEC